MEILILIIIVIVYCLVLNIDLYYIFIGGMIFLGVISALFTIAFLFCLICLLFSKRREARFVRTDHVKNSKYQVAYYSVDGKEYPCIFPKEGILEGLLYNKEKMYHVMLHQKLGKVFDRFAIATCMLGTIIGVLFCAGILYFSL